MTRPLRPIPAGPRHLAELVAGLRAALEGTGPALRVTPEHAASSLDRAVPSAPTPFGAHTAHPTDVPDDVALVVETSGSTGAPRGVLLSAAALRASAAATEDRLGGPGRWLLTLPTTHIAGLQVLVRSILAGTEPVAAGTGGFRPEAFVADAALVTGPRRYVSLVPTQLQRLLDEGGPGLAALATFDAVLLGGAATGPTMLARAAKAGVAVTTTYGMSETCGGCVYDGVPLDGMQVRIGDGGRVLLAGRMLASGYLGRPDLDAESFTESGGVRWFATSDAGSLDSGLLRVFGRLDDVLVTGGAKVSPAEVERLIGELAGVGEVCVVGVPDPEWGQLVTAVVSVEPTARPPTLATIRAHVTRNLGASAAPRRLVVIAERLPVRGPGKTDRRAVAELAAARST